MQERLLAHQRALEPWGGHAEELGLDRERFESCLESGRFQEAIRRDLAEGRKAGVSGTPSFVLGHTDPDDPTKVVGLAFIRGARPYASFAAEIERALAAAEAPGTDGGD